MPMNNMQKAAKNSLLLQSINVLGYQKQIKTYLADIFEKASLLELAFWKMAYRNERMEENAK